MNVGIMTSPKNTFVTIGDTFTMTTESCLFNTNESSESSLPLVNYGNNTESFQERWQTLSTRYLIHSLPCTIILLLLYVLVLIVGLIGNSLVILAFICRPHMRSVINTFILNLAVADLLAVLFCSLGNFLSNTIKPWILGSFMCKLVGYVQGMSVCASAFLLVAISVDRFTAVHRTTGLRRPQAIFIITFIWAIAICLPMPWAATLTLVQEKRFSYCTELWSDKLHGSIYFLCVNVFTFYVLPTILIIITNVMTWLRVNRRQVRHTTASVSIIAYVVPRTTRNEVRRMLGIVTIIFLLSWLPLYSLVIRYRYFVIGETEKKFMHAVLPFAQWLAISNSCINPVVYAFLNGNFQRAFQSMLPCLQKLFQKAKPPTVPMRGDNEEGMELQLLQRTPRRNRRV